MLSKKALEPVTGRRRVGIILVVRALRMLRSVVSMNEARTKQFKGTISRQCQLDKGLMCPQCWSVPEIKVSKSSKAKYYWARDWRVTTASAE